MAEAGPGDEMTKTNESQPERAESTSPGARVPFVKLLEKMRNNPKDDWVISDVQTL